MSVAVLLYHSVTRQPMAAIAQWAVSPATFRRHVQLIDASLAQPIGIAELAAGLSMKDAALDRRVAVTFDDGFADNVEAIALLAEHSIPTTVYVTTGLLGRIGYMGPATLRDLCDAGVEIGSHARTHRPLDQMPPTEAHAEISESKATLEDLLGVPCRSFAYPHGWYTASLRQQLPAAGYTSGCAVKNALSHWNDDPFAIARQTVRPSTTDRAFEEWLSGVGRPAWSGERIRTRVFRTYRRARRSHVMPTLGADVQAAS